MIPKAKKPYFCGRSWIWIVLLLIALCSLGFYDIVGVRSKRFNWVCFQKENMLLVETMMSFVGVIFMADETTNSSFPSRDNREKTKEEIDIVQSLPLLEDYNLVYFSNHYAKRNPVSSSSVAGRRLLRQKVEKNKSSNHMYNYNPDGSQDKSLNDDGERMLQRASDPTQPQPKVFRIELINAVTDQTILYGVLNGSAIPVATPGDLNFCAHLENRTTSATTGSTAGIRFGFNENRSFRVERLPPYCLCGDQPQMAHGINTTNFLRCEKLQYGTNTITATPFTTQFNTTTKKTTITDGESYAISFTLVPPSSDTSCSILPKLIGSWESYPSYPLQVAESQGSSFGNDFVLFSGFQNVYNVVTNRTFAIDLSSSSAVKSNGTWREMDPMPILTGLTHGALANVGNDTVYICGGYVGGHPGPATELCLKYLHTNPPGTQWSTMPSLPAKRAGGSLWYNTHTNSLIYTAGASRPLPHHLWYTIDHNDTWELSLNHVHTGWVTKPSLPYFGNHVGHVTVKYKGTQERHYIVGGQLGENETGGNLDHMFEWNVQTNEWFQRKSMDFKRGHFSESTLAYKDCGFIIIAGAINGINGTQLAKTKDISYYDIKTNTWTSIGNLSTEIATPACTIQNNEYIYCQSGYVDGKFSVRRQIV